MKPVRHTNYKKLQKSKNLQWWSAWKSLINVSLSGQLSHRVINIKSESQTGRWFGADSRHTHISPFVLTVTQTIKINALICASWAQLRNRWAHATAPARNKGFHTRVSGKCSNMTKNMNLFLKGRRVNDTESSKHWTMTSIRPGDTSLTRRD